MTQTELIDLDRQSAVIYTSKKCYDWADSCFSDPPGTRYNRKKELHDTGFVLLFPDFGDAAYEMAEEFLYKTMAPQILKRIFSGWCTDPDTWPDMHSINPRDYYRAEIQTIVFAADPHLLDYPAEIDDDDDDSFRALICVARDIAKYGNKKTAARNIKAGTAPDDIKLMIKVANELLADNFGKSWDKIPARRDSVLKSLNVGVTAMQSDATLTGMDAMDLIYENFHGEL